MRMRALIVPLLWLLAAAGTVRASDPLRIEVPKSSEACISKVKAEIDNGGLVVTGELQRRPSCRRATLVFAYIEVTLLDAGGKVLDQVRCDAPYSRRSVRRKARFRVHLSALPQAGSTLHVALCHRCRHHRRLGSSDDKSRSR